MNAWKCLNKGGILILDDYLWWFYKDINKNPSTPINNFLNENRKDISKLIVWNQIIIEKRL